MANQGPAPVEGIGATGHAPKAAATGGATEGQQAQAIHDAKKQTGTDNNANNGGDAAPVGDQAQLSPDAQHQLEAEAQKKKQEEEERQQAEIEAKQHEIEQTKQQIQQAEAQGDKAKVQQLTTQLHQQESDLAGLFDPPAAAAAPAATSGTSPLIPPPAGGFRGFGGGSGGGFNPMARFNGGAPIGFEPGGPRSTPVANPNVQIPDFGKNANKAQIGQMLDKASEKYGIPDNILKAVAWQESGWNSKALSFDGQHGKGVMQIDDRSHEFARTPDVFDPAKNIDYGAEYLKSLYDKTGSWQEALKRYNGGGDYPPKVLALADQQPWTKYTG